jgi:hypothetical protein
MNCLLNLEITNYYRKFWEERERERERERSQNLELGGGRQ